MPIDMGVLSNQLGTIGSRFQPRDYQGAAQGYMATLGAIQAPAAQQQISRGLQAGNSAQVVGGLAMTDPKSAVDFWSEMERNKAQLETNRLQRQTALSQNDEVRAETAYGKTMSMRNQLVQQHASELAAQRPDDAASTLAKINALDPVLAYQWDNLSRLNPEAYKPNLAPPAPDGSSGAGSAPTATPTGQPEAINKLTTAQTVPVAKDGVFSRAERDDLMAQSGAQSEKDFDSRFLPAIQEALDQVKATAVSFVTKNAQEYAGTKGRAKLAVDLTAKLGLSNASEAYKAAMDQQKEESGLVRGEQMSALERQAKLDAMKNGSSTEQNAYAAYHVAKNVEPRIGKGITKGDVATIRGYGQGTIASLVQSINRQSLSPEANQAMVWVDNVLRNESGAAIGKEEASNFVSNYIPEVGDDAGLRATKARNRQLKMDTMLIKSGKLGATELEESKAAPIPVAAPAEQPAPAVRKVPQFFPGRR